MIGFLLAFWPVLMAGLLGGASAGVAGVFVIGMRMPFLAVCSAHAAMAGAVLGLVVEERFLTWTGRTLPLPEGIWAFAGALAGAALLGWVLRGRRINPNAALGTLFSLMLGLTFLGMGLLEEGPKSQALALLWGSVVFVTPGDVITMFILAAIAGAFLFFLHKELKVLLFSRQLAAALLPEGAVFAALLALLAGIITINLQVVGGLLLFSLLSNPAVAALRLARSYFGALLWAALLGAASAIGGFAIAYLLDLPAGACIVLVSCMITGGVLYRAKKREENQHHDIG